MNIVLPVGIDAEAIALRQFRGTVTYGQILTDINDAMQLKRQAVFADPSVAGATYITQDIEVYYRSGNTNGFEARTEYGEPDEQRADERGHMLPVSAYDRALGWSEAYLEKAKPSQIDNDIAESVTDYEELAQKSILRGHFRSTALSGKQYGLGATGISAPFCDGGTADSGYIPPRARGQRFDATHNHYLRQSAINQANLEIAVNHLWEHGHDGPYILQIADADISYWTDTSTVTGFVVVRQQGVDYGANQTLAASTEGRFIGVITTKRGTCYVLPQPRLDAGYYNVHKSYGQDDPRNPLYIFEEEGGSLAPTLKVPVPRVLPIQGGIVAVKYGVGVGRDRTNGVAVKIAGSGSYADPSNLMA